MLGVSFIPILKSKIYTALTTQNTTENKTVLSHMHKKRRHFVPKFFLTGIHQLLITSKERSAIPSANICQGQMQTPQSLSFLGSRNNEISSFFFKILTCERSRRKRVFQFTECDTPVRLTVFQCQDAPNAVSIAVCFEQCQLEWSPYFGSSKVLQSIRKPRNPSVWSSGYRS